MRCMRRARSCRSKEEEEEEGEEKEEEEGEMLEEERVRESYQIAWSTEARAFVVSMMNIMNCEK